MARKSKNPPSMKPMKGREYKDALTALGLNISSGARFIGVDLSTSRRYANDRSAIPFCVKAFLAVAIHYRLTTERLDAILE